MATSEIWDHGDPLWEQTFFAQNEIWTYGVVRAIANSPRAGLLRRRTREGRGQRVITDILRPVIVDKDPLGNEVTQRVCLTQRRWVPRSSNKSDADLPVVVQHEMTVLEAVDGDLVSVATFQRPKLHAVLSRSPDGMAVSVALAKPLDILKADLYPELQEQAQFIGYLELLHVKLGLDVPVLR